MKKWTSLAALLALVALVSVAVVRAEKEDDKDEAKHQVDLSDLGSAFQMMEYGRDHDAPEALVTAAGLLKNVSRAKVHDLKADKVEILNNKGEAVEDTSEVYEASKVNLKQEYQDLLDEADVMASKKKINLGDLVKAVKNRELKKTDKVGDVWYYGRPLAGEQTMVIPLKVDGDQMTNIAIRAGEAVKLSVSRDKDGKDTLASILTMAGNLPFKANKGEAVTRGVVIVKKVVPVRPVVIVQKVPPPTILIRPVKTTVIRKVRIRGIGTGDTNVFVRVHNPSRYASSVELFFN